MKKRVLVIDDSEVVRRQIVEHLSAIGYEIIEAVDGLDGLRKIENHNDISLIICDVNMPHLSGPQMVRQAQESLRQKNIPVVMLTTEGNSVLVEEAKRYGATGWLFKPYNPEYLIEIVKKLTSCL